MRRALITALIVVSCGAACSTSEADRALKESPEPAGAQDANHRELAPSEGLFSAVGPSDPYQIAVRDALTGDSQYRRCELVVIPSRAREWAVYVLRDDDHKPVVVSRRMRQPLWDQMREVRSALGTKEAQAAALKHMSIEVDTARAEITPGLADLLEEVWWKMLGRVHYTEEGELGLDGVDYYVSHWSPGRGVRSGMTFSPPPGSRPADMVSLAEVMATLSVMGAGSARDEADAKLRTQARALLDRLK